MKIYLYKIFFQVKDVINIVKGFTIGTIIQQLIIFLSIPIFTRLLPPEELGVFMLFTAFSLVVSHLTWFGSNQSIIKQYPEIISGRKNYEFFEKRILKNLELIKKYKKKIKY